jgi:hypothetical protein
MLDYSLIRAGQVVDNVLRIAHAESTVLINSTTLFFVRRDWEPYYDRWDHPISNRWADDLARIVMRYHRIDHPAGTAHDAFHDHHVTPLLQYYLSGPHEHGEYTINDYITTTMHRSRVLYSIGRVFEPSEEIEEIEMAVDFLANYVDQDSIFTVGENERDGEVVRLCIGYYNEIMAEL